MTSFRGHQTDRIKQITRRTLKLEALPGETCNARKNRIANEVESTDNNNVYRIFYGKWNHDTSKGSEFMMGQKFVEVLKTWLNPENPMSTKGGGGKTMKMRYNLTTLSGHEVAYCYTAVSIVSFYISSTVLNYRYPCM
jgi:hypothetical protein